jgi:hypothetical protein
LIEQVTETREYQRLLEELRRDARVISISGLVAGAARALAVAALQRDTGKTFAVVSHTTRDLESWERDLRFWYSALSAKEADDKDILVLPRRLILTPASRRTRRHSNVAPSPCGDYNNARRSSSS